MTRAFVVPLSLALLAATLAGCTKPEPPEKDRPPEPTAASTATSTAYTRPVQKHDDLLRYMQTPIEKAKTAEQSVMDAAQAQRADIEAQTQGNAPAAPAESQPPAY